MAADHAFTGGIMQKKSNQWVLLDDEGMPVRYFDYPADGTVEVVVKKWKPDWNNFEECLL